MDFKRVIRFNALRTQLSEQELTLADALRDASEAERTLLVEALAPQKPARQTQKQRNYVRCDICNTTKGNKVHKDTELIDYHEFTEKKSARAQSLGKAISTRTKERADASESVESRCTFLRSDLGGTACGMLPDHNVHHLESAQGYHEFVAAETAVGASS